MMVAYSFKAAFVPDIQAGIKRQTIRLPRRRHALPGESLQLYSGMRTRHCAKIIPDPACVGVDAVVIDARSGALDRIEVNGIAITDGDELDAFARADGFGRHGARPSEHMARWWTKVHGHALHEDLVCIRWEARP